MKPQMINDHFQNFKRYGIPKAQLIIADLPYNVGKNAYGSNPSWYIDGDRKNGESNLAGKEFFDTDKDFRIMEFFHFCNRLLKKEPKGKMSELKEKKNEPACMIVFCAFEQLNYAIEKAKDYALVNFQPLIFTKNFSAQVLKANMRLCGNCEYGLLLWRDRLPKFRNLGEDGKRHMIFNQFQWIKDTKTPKIHSTQKPVQLLEKLIKTFTDPGDVVIDPVAGSGSTLLAAHNLGRRAYGFEIKKEYCKDYHEKIEPLMSNKQMSFINEEVKNAG